MLGPTAFFVALVLALIVIGTIMAHWFVIIAGISFFLAVMTFIWMRWF